METNTTENKATPAPLTISNEQMLTANCGSINIYKDITIGGRGDIVKVKYDFTGCNLSTIFQAAVKDLASDLGNKLRPVDTDSDARRQGKKDTIAKMIADKFYTVAVATFGKRGLVFETETITAKAARVKSFGTAEEKAALLAELKKALEDLT